MKVVNVFGAPGSGKSTLRSGLFYRMKMEGLSVEDVTEFAKDCVWEQQNLIFQDQIYLFAQQNRKQERLRHSVDWAVTDSPLLLSCIYANTSSYYDQFNPLVINVWDSYDNINILVNRTHPFEQQGRVHSESQSVDINNQLKHLLMELNVDFIYVNSDNIDIDKIFDTVIKGNQ